MNKGVEILLERMTSNPDEFVPPVPGVFEPIKWSEIISSVYARKHGREGHPPYYDLSFLSDEEVDALFNKLQSIRGDHFTKSVMSTLLTDDSSDEESRRKLTETSLIKAIQNMKQTSSTAHDKIVLNRTQVELMKKELERQRQDRYEHGIEE